MAINAAGSPGGANGVEEVHILWTSEGMSCDGDSVSVTAAMQPSIEDVVLGIIPGLPKVHLHNKVLAYETGEEFLKAFRQAANGELEPFILVVEGSIPNEKINGDGYWTSMGNDPVTGEPITLNEWIDRLAPRAWAVVAIATCATYGGIHAMAGIPIVNVPGCPVQPDNFMETLLWLLYQAAGLSPMIPLDAQPDLPGSSAKRCTRAVTGLATMSRATSRWTITPRSAR